MHISVEGGEFTANSNGTYTNNFYDNEIPHSFGGSTVEQPSGTNSDGSKKLTGLTTTNMQVSCTDTEITDGTGICVLGNAFKYGSGYPKLYRLNPDGSISTENSSADRNKPLS